MNLLDKTQLDQEMFWKIVKKARRSFLLVHSEPECQSKESQILLSVEYIEETITIVEKTLQLNASLIAKKPIPAEILKNGAEMFTYLNYCPPKLYSFISHLISNGSPKEMILALITIKRKLLNAGKHSSAKILIHLLKNLGLRQYEHIQIITKRNLTRNVEVKEESSHIIGFYLCIKF